MILLFWPLDCEAGFKPLIAPVLEEISCNRLLIENFKVEDLGLLLWLDVTFDRIDKELAA